MSAVTLRCPSCELEVSPGLTFCPRCRAQAQGRRYDPTETDRHERAYVLSLVLLSLGALAVPRLWRSKAFTGAQKALLSVLGAANTTLALGLAYYAGFVWLPGILEHARGAGR